MEKIYHIKSPSKSIITVSNGNITIEAKGFLNTLNKGLSGAKTFKVKNITSVQIKKPGLTNGYIQFGFAGDSRKTQGVFSATSDENSVMFSKKYYKDMLELKDYIDNYEEQPSIVHSNTQSVADELLKLKQLLDADVITEREFADLRSKLLN